MSSRKFNEIYLIDDPSLKEAFDAISSEERMFVYYMYRANLPFIRMARDQNGFYTNEIIDIFEFLYQNGAKLESNFLADVKIFLVYLWVNNGVYFQREYTNNKRTPKKIGLKYLNRETL